MDGSMSMGAFIFMILGGAVLIAVGAFGLSQTKAENRDARAVRAFFKGYTDSHQISYIGPIADGGWEIHVRDLNDPRAPYSAVPTALLLQLSNDTNQTTPWTKIVVDPAQDKGEPKP